MSQGVLIHLYYLLLLKTIVNIICSVYVFKIKSAREDKPSPDLNYGGRKDECITWLFT